MFWLFYYSFRERFNEFNQPLEHQSSRSWRNASHTYSNKIIIHTKTMQNVITPSLFANLVF